jgi:hypothetical protein
MTKKPRAEVIYYFCDETSMHDTIMGVGGLAVPDYNLEPITARLQEINEQLGVFYEVKWSSTKDRINCGQTAYAKYLKQVLSEEKAHFHIRWAPFKKYNHKESGPKRRVDTTSKMYYQLLLHRAVRFYGRHYKLHVRPDNGDCTAELRKFKDYLQMDGRAEYGAARDCIASIECRDSAKEPLLQMLDVTTGALTALRNSRPLLSPKARLAKSIHEMHGEPDLALNSPPEEMKFSIWNVIPKWGKRGSRG